MDERKRIKNSIYIGEGGRSTHLNGWIVKTFTKIEQALGITELSGKRQELMVFVLKIYTRDAH